MSVHEDGHSDPTLDLQLSNTDYTADATNFDWLSQEWDWLRSPSDNATLGLEARDPSGTVDTNNTDPIAEADANLEARKQTFWKRW